MQENAKQRFTVLGLALVVSAVMLTSCAQTTSSNTLTYTDPDFMGRSFDSFVVQTVSTSLSERQAIENTTVNELYAAGAEAVPLLQVIPPTRMNRDENTVRRTIMNTGAAAVLEIRPTQHRMEKMYLSHPYYPRGAYMYDDAFYVGIPLYSRGYTVEEPHAVYEATLYTLPGYKAAWTGEFKVSGPAGMGFDSLGARFANRLVKRMVSDGLVMSIAPTEPKG